MGVSTIFKDPKSTDPRTILHYGKGLDTTSLICIVHDTRPISPRMGAEDQLERSLDRNGPRKPQGDGAQRFHPDVGQKLAAHLRVSRATPRPRVSMISRSRFRHDGSWSWSSSEDRYMPSWSSGIARTATRKRQGHRVRSQLVGECRAAAGEAPAGARTRA